MIRQSNRIVILGLVIVTMSFALGSAAWDAVAQRTGIRVALVYAGIGTIGSIAVAFFAELPESTADLSPWNHWRMPALVKGLVANLDQGPVLVTVEYVVTPEGEAAFLEAIHEYARVRRRDGAYSWGIFHDTEIANHYLDTFLVNSWAEHFRQHERQTQSDRELEQRLHSSVAGDPKVRHLIYANSTET
jgi:hypothetical protein